MDGLIQFSSSFYRKITRVHPATAASFYDRSVVCSSLPLSFSPLPPLHSLCCGQRRTLGFLGWELVNLCLQIPHHSFQPIPPPQPTMMNTATSLTIDQILRAAQILEQRSAAMNSLIDPLTFCKLGRKYQSKQQ
jgi:hypothetical protein